MPRQTAIVLPLYYWWFYLQLLMSYSSVEHFIKNFRNIGKRKEFEILTIGIDIKILTKAYRHVYYLWNLTLHIQDKKMFYLTHFQSVKSVLKHRIQPCFSKFFWNDENKFICTQFLNLSADKHKEYAQKNSKSSFDRVKIDSNWKITIFTSCSKFLLRLGEITHTQTKILTF